MEPICLQGRTLSGDDLTALRALMAQHPDWHRTALSRHLCELWNWRNGAGRLKDMAARSLLLKLQARGVIELPPPQTRTGRPCAQAPPRLPPEWLSSLPTPIEDNLASLQPVSLELAHMAIGCGWSRPSWSRTVLPARPIKPPVGCPWDRPLGGPGRIATELCKALSNRSGYDRSTLVFANT